MQQMLEVGASDGLDVMGSASMAHQAAAQKKADVEMAELQAGLAELKRQHEQAETKADNMEINNREKLLCGNWREFRDSK